MTVAEAQASFPAVSAAFVQGLAGQGAPKRSISAANVGYLYRLNANKTGKNPLGVNLSSGTNDAQIAAQLMAAPKSSAGPQPAPAPVAPKPAAAPAPKPIAAAPAPKPAPVAAVPVAGPQPAPAAVPKPVTATPTAAPIATAASYASLQAQFPAINPAYFQSYLGGRQPTAADMQYFQQLEAQKKAQAANVAQYGTPEAVTVGGQTIPVTNMAVVAQTPSGQSIAVPAATPAPAPIAVAAAPQVPIAAAASVQLAPATNGNGASGAAASQALV